MKVDITSDIHLDFWVDCRHPSNKQHKMIKNFMLQLLPESPSGVLVIAGDVGHYNWQNAIMFEVLRKTYDKILWVHGNHDLYMVSNKIEKKFGRNSFNRLQNMIELSNQIDGVHYLDGTMMDFGEFTIGGAGGWYDGSYGTQMHGLTKERIMELFRDVMNDSNLIRVEGNKELDIFEYAMVERRKLKAIYNKCDLVVSHIGPDWCHVPYKYRNTSTTFYYFDGRNMLSDMKPNAYWAFGHTHDMHYFKHQLGPTIICNPLGYPNDNSDVSRRKFFTIELGMPFPSYEEVFR